MSRQELVTAEAPNVKADWVEYEEEGTRFGRRRLRTPVGEVYSTHRLGGAYGSSWYVDHFIKRPEDYQVVAYWIRDIVYRASYDGYHHAVQEIGEDGYVSGNFGYSPLMEMRVNLLGPRAVRHRPVRLPRAVPLPLERADREPAQSLSAAGRIARGGRHLLRQLRAGGAGSRLRAVLPSLL